MTDKRAASEEEIAGLFQGLDGLTVRRRSVRNVPAAAAAQNPSVKTASSRAERGLVERTVLSKSGLAVQQAIVKLTHLTHGRQSIVALFKSMFGDGTTLACDHSGVTFGTLQALKVVVDTWVDEADYRRPSKDVFRFRLTTPEGPEIRERLEKSLHEVFAGHCYAWTSGYENDRAWLHGVASTSARDAATGKTRRIADKELDIAVIREKLQGALKAAVHFELYGFDHGLTGLRRQATALTRAGTIAARSVRPAEAGQSVSVVTFTDRASMFRETRLWPLHSRTPRDVAHILFCAKEGTPALVYYEAVREMLAIEFASFDYVCSPHTDHRNIFARATVRMGSRDGERLNPRVADLKRWRQTLCAEATARGIPLLSNMRKGTPRQEP
ncbi:hypothetical protein AB4Y96_15980 [Phyllobacterium sp. TAF24]|uniref:hypothetical protein n=1 Tax=Phyllobacterium sp. TAF24 TaxID=3233068 RepID=UPI003F95A4D5